MEPRWARSLHWNGNAWVSDSGLYVSNKRFGIGINTPEAPLSVVAGANLAVFNAKRAANFDPGEFEIAFDGPDSTGLSIDEVTDTGNESRLFIEGGTGSVGIGTTAPQAPLAVTSSSSGDVIRFKAPENGAYNIDWAMRFIAPGAPNSGLGITDESSGASQTRLFIADTTGNVGIGTTDPDAALTIRSGNELKQHFQNGDVPTSSDFWNTIDSYGMNTGQGSPDSAHIHLTLQSSTGHLGVGTNDPPAPLAIKSREVLKTYFETGDIPAQDNFGFTSNSAGFGIQQGTPSSLTSRMFIQGTTGFVGIGTITPEQKLHIEDASPGGLTGLKILNTASVGNQGWRMGHLQDTGERDGAFSILEETGTGLLERITVLPSGHVGVNEPVPDTKLHVSRSVSDPSTAINLMEGTGIMTPLDP
ncbi:MAG: hypothetical protein IPG92_13565 [Flavobacteriales bacterium]|nr:hypothetical protein [Flavobacteriales bacterium]